MATTWIRRSFQGAGITQVPPGPGIGAVQRRHANGTVMLLIDVSNSMQGWPNPPYLPGSRLEQAVLGARRFVDQAVGASYKVGIILWHTGVAELRLPSDDAAETYQLLASSTFPTGGTDLYPALARCYDVLQDHTGDRVVAIFGDGDLGTPGRVLPLVAEMKAENIRFVTRGLGDVAAQAFGEVSDEEPERARVDDEAKLADSIAGMASALKGSGA
jgi:Mg-chelatase subunit ChlD